MTSLPATDEAGRGAGAASHGGVEWRRIDWKAAYKHVRRLQSRIVRATREGRWGEVEYLQRLVPLV